MTKIYLFFYFIARALKINLITNYFETQVVFGVFDIIYKLINYYKLNILIFEMYIVYLKDCYKKV